MLVKYLMCKSQSTNRAVESSAKQLFSIVLFGPLARLCWYSNVFKTYKCFKLFYNICSFKERKSVLRKAIRRLGGAEL